MAGCLAADAPRGDPIRVVVTALDAPGVVASAGASEANATGGADVVAKVAAPLPYGLTCAWLDAPRDARIACPPMRVGPHASASWRAHAPTGTRTLALLVYPAEAANASAWGLHARLVRDNGSSFLLVLEAPSTNATMPVGVSNLTLRCYRIDASGRATPEDKLDFVIRTYMPAHGHYGHAPKSATSMGNGTYVGAVEATMAGEWEVRAYESEHGIAVTWRVLARQVD